MEAQRRGRVKKGQSRLLVTVIRSSAAEFYGLRMKGDFSRGGGKRKEESNGGKAYN